MIRSGWSAALLAYVALGADQMRPGDRITPSLVLYRAITTLLDRFGRLQRVLSALVLDRVVGDERVAAAFDLAGTFHSLQQALLRIVVLDLPHKLCDVVVAAELQLVR